MVVFCLAEFTLGFKPKRALRKEMGSFVGLGRREDCLKCNMENKG